MNWHNPIAGTAAFTRKDLLAILAVVGLLGCLLVVWLERGRDRARSVCCNCNLKQVGLSFRLWSQDNTNQYPMSVSTNFGGAQEFVKFEQAFQYFQSTSNELNTPLILVCPADTREPARNFASLSNSNLSYFVGLDAVDTNPQGLLCGDRNVTGGRKLANGILEISTNDPVGWSDEMHRTMGNVAFADGHVDSLNAAALREAVQNSGNLTNRLAIP
jgi:prepilin-type processing-associated H-X9-DG protein